MTVSNGGRRNVRKWKRLRPREVSSSEMIIKSDAPLTCPQEHRIAHFKGQFSCPNSTVDLLFIPASLAIQVDISPPSEVRDGRNGQFTHWI